jgi:hypothetical protein
MLGAAVRRRIWDAFAATGGSVEAGEELGSLGCGIAVGVCVLAVVGEVEGSRLG